jgi:PHD/YefM family antitoxin component YafN of YafNO toxin-antitoxin module
MIIQNVTNFRKDIFNTLNQVTKYNEVAAITTKDGGAAMIISKEDYDSMMETIYCVSIPGVREDLEKALKAPDTDFVEEDKLEW